MKSHIIAAAALVIALPSVARVKPNTVLMTVDGQPVTVGEFEYLYNKNNTQQLNPQSLDEYLLMFENYKLKVAEAEHAGIDNTPAFESEFIKFRDELAAPYLVDKATEDALVNEAYSHRKDDVSVSHIMLPHEEKNIAKLDSIRNAIIAGAVSFENAAKEYSVDRGSKARGGKMGFVVPDRFPWSFEKAAYDTPVGEISKVTDSGVGYHLIRVDSKEPSKGEVDASHILIMTRGLDKAGQEAAKVRIDSVYKALMNGADFARLAEKVSQDPGSASRGGALGRFGHGMMVAEFDSAAFATPANAISKPFATAYGYHIVKTNEHFGVPELDDKLRKAIIERMAQDDRANMATNAKIDQLMSDYKAGINEKTIAAIGRMISDKGGIVDSATITNIVLLKGPVATFKGGNVSAQDAMAYLPMEIGTDTEAAVANIREAADNALRAAVLDYARKQLENTVPEYRNLVNEYRDGILLYEISNRKVWDKANKDAEGLKAFFEANKDKYRWEKPKFKSYVFFASSDSVLAEAMRLANTLDPSDPTVFTQELRKKFGRNIKVERVIAAQGENPITDYLGFNGSKPAADRQTKWASYGAWKGRVLAQPEEASDVRGVAVTDYQAQLEAEWIKELHKKYPVKVNKKVFEKLKKEANKQMSKAD